MRILITPVTDRINKDDNFANDYEVVSSSMVLSVMLDTVLLESNDRHNTLVKICEQIKKDLVQYPSKLSLAAHSGALQALYAYTPIGVEKL